MAEIQEVFEDIKEKVGDKGFVVLIAGAVAFGLYNLVKGSGGSGDTLTTVNAVASYPDSVTNADVIISTLQDSIDYSEGEIKEEIQGLGDELKIELDNNFEETNNYITSGLESQSQLMQENFDTLQGSIDNLGSDLSNQITNVESNITEQIDNVDSKIDETSQSLLDSMSGLQSSNQSLTNAVNNMKSELTKKPATTTTKKPATTTQKTTTTTTKKQTTSYYTYKTKKGLNTSTSIVDALKAIGVDSSMSNRKKIAKANGVKNYTGTAKQNISLLNKLKKGTLKKV